MKRKIGALLLVAALVLGFGLVPLVPVGASPAPAIAGLWHLDSDAGDTSGNGNDGSLVGDAIIGPSGYFSPNTLNLDGNGDYVTVPDDASLDISDVITVEAWVNVTSCESGRYYTVVGKWNDRDGNYRSYLLCLYATSSSTLEPRFYISTSGSDYPKATSNQSISTGQWYHLVGTFDGDTITIGFDEMEKGSYSLSAAIATNDQPLLIGGDRAGGSNGRYFHGLIDEVRIWNSVPIDFEVSATPTITYNPVTASEHSITATVDPVAPGAIVGLEVISGPNEGNTDGGPTNSNGQITLSYTSNGGAGTDIIRIWVDLNWDGNYDEGVDHSTTVTKVWLENFVTGGGKLNMDTLDLKGKRVAMTFAGTVGVLEGEGIVGQFHIVDHESELFGAEAWHCNNNFSYLVFEGPAAESPEASHDTAIFRGIFESNRGNTMELWIKITDNGEGKKGPGVDGILFSLDGEYWFGANIDGGNFQVHDIE